MNSGVPLSRFHTGEMRAAEEAEVLRNFIELYESLPELWNPKNPMYTIKTIRNAAMDKLLSVYVKLKPGANRGDVRRKINTLRCNYRTELKKVVASKRSGNSTQKVYTPTSWVFYALQFLNKCQQPVNAKMQQIKTEVPDDDEIQNEVHEEQYPTLSVRTTSRSSILIPPIENEHLQKACACLEQPRESQVNIPTIAKAWGEKLCTLDHQQRALAEKAVNDILFEASQGTLHRYSVKINQNLS